MKVLLGILACGLCLGLFAVELSDGWTLAIDPKNEGKACDWAEAERPGARPVPVPGVIQQVYPRYCGVVWYYRQLSRPVGMRNGERLKLCFGAVDYYCEVYLDGTLLGKNEGAENPFGFDVTDVLKERSLLAVRVINPGDDEIEGFVCQKIPHRNKYEQMEFKPGWCYNTGGIMLPVTLENLPPVRVTDAYVIADWKTGRVKVETALTNELSKAVNGDVTYVVRSDDAAYPVCSHVERRLIPPGEMSFVAEFDIPGHKLWSVDAPNVYQLSVDNFTTRFGFRDFRLKDGWFHLNGKRIFLKSAHTGNHMPGGLAVVDQRTPELEFRDFQNMKAMGYNTVRFIATQATPRQLDYCDRLGLMVYQETYASWCLKNSPEAKRRYLESIRAELLRDRNHPSLMIWGALNETKQEDAFQAAKGMLGEMSKIDATRLWILNSGRWDLFPAYRDVKEGPRQDQADWPGPDWSVGSAANPGATAWENHWGDDGNLADEKLAAARANKGREFEYEPPYYGDLHFYPGYPHAGWAARKIREWGKGTRPVFISEYGVGSLLDVIDHCFEFERRGIPAESPDYARMAEIRDKYLADWKKLGMSRFFPDPVDFLRESERYNARSRREGFDLVRSNPRMAGYNLTGALDHAICGEGPMSLFRRLKDGNFDVFRDGWSDLRWCLFLSKYNWFVGDEIEFEAVLADFEALKDGDYRASFAIVDVDGVQCWKSEETPFAVPQKDPDGNRAVVYPIVKTKAAAKLAPGKYLLRAYLDHGGYAAAFEKAFYVTARPAKAEGFIDLGKVSDEEGAAAMRKVAEEGATALVRLDRLACKTPKYLPLANLVIKPREHWLYHDDTVVVPDALTKGLKVGFLDWDFYEGSFPLQGFTTDTEPESFAAVNFNVGGPKVYLRSFSLATFRHGKGRLVLTTMPLDAASPAGALILSNIVGNIIDRGHH